MRCRGVNHQIAAKRSFCGLWPGLCRCTADRQKYLYQADHQKRSQRGADFSNPTV